MIKIIVAVDEKGAIGRNNDLLYFIKEDLKNFKNLTTGNIIVMGRKTWESLPIKPLPNRDNVILTTSSENFEGAKTLGSLDELKEYMKDQDRDIYIIGGASIYNQVIDNNIADEAHITFVKDIAIDADTFINIKKLEKLLPNKKYITTFKNENITADYVILSK